MTTVILLLVLAGLVATLRLLLVSSIRHDGYGRPSTGDPQPRVRTPARG